MTEPGRSNGAVRFDLFPSLWAGTRDAQKHTQTHDNDIECYCGGRGIS